MKKLSFLVAGLMLGGFVMAQTATVNQTSAESVPPSEQTANVTQTGNSSVKITQTTEKLEYPENVNVKFDNTASATQSGNGNKIVVHQEADGKINGGNYWNKAEALQDGSNNELSQTQKSADFTSGGMDFTSKQFGTGNIGKQYSEKTGADFDLYQNGKTNTAEQRTTGVKTGILNANIKQIGNSNDAVQLFHGIDVRYAGANIEQYGNNGEAKQEFENSNHGTWTTEKASKADIIQTVGSSSEFAYQKQIGEGSYQYIKQTGANNEARMWSIGDYNQAYAVQNGTWGDIRITQRNDNAAVNDGNLTMVKQDGNGSMANILQEGERNAVVGLSGSGYAINNNGATLKVVQEGSDNIVQSYQNVNAIETVTQMGMNNTAIVKQY